MMVEIVREYGNEIPKLISRIKEKHVEDGRKDEAEMIFSTVHRSKGMEYDSVQLVNDFIDEEKILSLLKGKNKNDEHTIEKLNEEINLLYVAITRAKNSLHIPESFLPAGFPAAKNIHALRNNFVEQTEEELLLEEKTITKAGILQEKAYTVESIREKHRSAYIPWTEELDEELTVMYLEGIHVKDIAKHFGRTKGAIHSRLQKLEVLETEKEV